MNSNFRNNRSHQLATSEAGAKHQQLYQTSVSHSHSHSHSPSSSSASGSSLSYSRVSPPSFNYSAAESNGLPIVNGNFKQKQQSSARVKAPSASDYSMPPMSAVNASVKLLADQLNQTHLDGAGYNGENNAANDSKRHQLSRLSGQNNQDDFGGHFNNQNQNQNSHQQQRHFQYNQYPEQSDLDSNANSNFENYQQYQFYSTSKHHPDRTGETAGGNNNINSSHLDYANQIRQSQFKQRYEQPQTQLHHQNPSTSHQLQQHHLSSRNQQVNGHQQAQSNHQPKSSETSDTSQEQRSTMHVNFNRYSRNNNDNANCDDPAESSGRKKKYLTAKYGQQQMNLIKKRLKVEMWLYEQLKELAKGTKSEDELDEIDIDLDEILDMEGDDPRRNWLMKILEPYDDLPRDRVDKFVSEVIEQSKLL